MAITDWRTRIDEVDKQLVRLLSVRVQLAIEIGREKKEAGVEIYDAVRETTVIAQALRENPGVLTQEALERLFLEIIRESRDAAAHAAGSAHAAEAHVTNAPVSTESR